MYTFRDKFCIGSLIKLLYILFYTFGLVEGIRGGENVNDGEFTHQVAVLINHMHACGGAILNSNHIVSGAQCVLDPRGNFINAVFHVIFGISSSNGWALSERIKVHYIYVLLDFRRPNRTNILFPEGLESGDLSILKLAKQISLQPGTGATNVDLPSKFYHHYHKFTYETANVSGFGQHQPTTYKSSSDLSNLGYRRNLHGEMKYISQRVEGADFCNDRYSRFPQGLSNNHLCSVSIDDNPAGVCFGDAGGPLVIENELIGILQIYNTNCDDRVIPAIYTRVTEYLEFINDAMQSRFKSNMRLANYTGAVVNEIIHESRRG